VVAIKIDKFQGIAPRTASELLPSGVAQVAKNANVNSGNLIPYTEPKVSGNTGRSGSAKTLFGLRNLDDTEFVWLSWDKDVDIVTITDAYTEAEDAVLRFYYTGDGKPKATTFGLATQGSGPYPSVDYDLGLPLPDTILGGDAEEYVEASTQSYARDAANTATIVTSVDHNLRDGAIISVTGFDTDEGVPRTFNAKNIEATVLDDRTITYFSPGSEVSTTSNSDGKVSLAGFNRPRTYVYTWLTPWGEESIASEPSDPIYVREGQTVTVNNLPQNPPSGNNFIRGVRLYRTLTTASGSEYFRLRTLWFPTKLASVARSGNVATVTLQEPHNLIVDDRIKISGAFESSFNVTDADVTEIVDRYTFRFNQSGSNVSTTTETGGTLYHDVSETLDDPARYWGDNTYNFTDDFESSALSFSLTTNDYDPPPDGLQNIISAQNNILAGFVGNRLFFSEPRQLHAWPERYALTFPYSIVGIEAVQGQIVVLTDKYPYRVYGSDPAVMTYSRVDVPYPCLSKKSIVNMGFGVVFATHGGLAEYDPASGAALITRALFDWDSWRTFLDPTTITAEYFDGRYFASHSGGSFIFEADQRGGGIFITLDETFDAAWNDPITNEFYFTKGTNGDIFRWGAPDQPFKNIEWRSRTIKTETFANMAAARVQADYTDASAMWDEVDTTWGTRDVDWNTDGNVLFELFVDRERVFQRILTDDKTFRLPVGYKSDTFSVSVSGASRVRSIHIGTSASELRQV